MASLREGTLLAMGNPLLDITASTGKDFLEKYDLKPNDAILAEDKHMPMYQELVDKYDVEFTAGGSAQNTVRAAQWAIGTPKVFSYMGSIGKDKFGDILAEKAMEAGVDVHYQRQDTIPTGTCAVVITDGGINRSLCANLAAANAFKSDQLSLPENEQVISRASFYYITGFFLTVSPPSIMTIANHARSTGKLFIMNLSAPFICQFFRQPLMEAFPYIDILFGNETEAQTLAKELAFKSEELTDIALHLSQLPKNDSSRPRRVIITQGEKPVIMAYDGEISMFPIQPVSNILDTNGAGDAFVGGFLSQLIQGKSIEECIKCGAYVASVVIQRSGCTFPPKCEYRSS